jgi:hypothetical protein
MAAWVGFSTSTWHPASMLVRWWTKSRVSHTFLLYDDTNIGLPMVYDVSFTGLRLIPYSVFLRDNKVVEEIKIEEDLTPGLQVVSRWLGRRYDWGAFFGFCRLFAKRVRHPSPDPKELICTEAVIHVLRLAGYPEAASLDPKRTSPQALLDFLNTSPKPNTSPQQ